VRRRRNDTDGRIAVLEERLGIVQAAFPPGLAEWFEDEEWDYRDFVKRLLRAEETVRVQMGGRSGGRQAALQQVKNGTKVSGETWTLQYQIVGY
jgi:hypothetical protein